MCKGMEMGSKASVDLRKRMLLLSLGQCIGIAQSLRGAW